MGIQEIAFEVTGRYRTTQDMVSEGLREAILGGTLAGGEALRQEELGERFGVSRIPVREALRQLEGEGLVEFHPHRSAVVTSLSYLEVEEISEIRVSLETLALRRALPMMSRESLDRAGEVLNLIDAEEDLRKSWGELNWRFHEALFAPAERPRLISLIKSQHTAFERYIRFHLALADYDKPQHEHRELLELCRRGESGAAEALLARHIQDISGLLQEHLDRLPVNEANQGHPKKATRPA
ncbi:GntR family transcriptional regulator [Rubrobacter aplysinae]|uniref:GntR family transcriptional regulator n=1 Tax=Rubrobacter aplysinae TaxID=909625 RepID=UPI00064BE56C|nr:GntR family transcriptional regulator [Rubrobacter aplysinae]